MAEETVYTIRYFDVTRKKMILTRWKMTEAQAAERFADTKWEVVLATKEVRKTGGDMLSTSLAHLQGPGSKNL